MVRARRRSIPDPRGFPDELTQVLAVLFRACTASADPWLATSAISSSLLDQFGISVNVRRVFGLLASHGELAAKRKRGEHWEFRILEAGKRTVISPSDAVVLVDPESPIPAIIELHGFIGRLKGTVRICDPYVDPVTMTHLDACGPKVNVQLLTSHIREDVTVRAAVRQFVRNQRALEVRRSASGKLHDRYVVDDTTAFLMGTSLNGFGRTRSAVVPVGKDVRSALVKQFDEEWVSARPWQ